MPKARTLYTIVSMPTASAFPSSSRMATSPKPNFDRLMRQETRTVRQSSAGTMDRKDENQGDGYDDEGRAMRAQSDPAQDERHAHHDNAQEPGADERVPDVLVVGQRHQITA